MLNLVTSPSFIYIFEKSISQSAITRLLTRDCGTSDLIEAQSKYWSARRHRLHLRNWIWRFFTPVQLQYYSNEALLKHPAWNLLCGPSIPSSCILAGSGAQASLLLQTSPSFPLPIPRAVPIGLNTRTGINVEEVCFNQLNRQVAALISNNPIQTLHNSLCLQKHRNCRIVQALSILHGYIMNNCIAKITAGLHRVNYFGS